MKCSLTTKNLNFYLEGVEILSNQLLIIRNVIIKDHLLCSFFLRIIIKFLEDIQILEKKVKMLVNGKMEKRKAFCLNTITKMDSKYLNAKINQQKFTISMVAWLFLVILIYVFQMTATSTLAVIATWEIAMKPQMGMPKVQMKLKNI